MKERQRLRARKEQWGRQKREQSQEPSVPAPAASGCVAWGRSLHLSVPDFLLPAMGVFKCVGTPSWTRRACLCALAGVTGKGPGVAMIGDKEAGCQAASVD